MAGKKSARPAAGKRGRKAPAKRSQKPKDAAVPADTERDPGKTKAARPRESRAKRFPIVAIGASAGGLDAFKKFLAATPSGTGMAFVLIPHLDPSHESLMVELLARQTVMPVREAAHGMPLEPSHVYIIPPNKYLAISDGKLLLSKPPVPRGQQTAIDFSLSSLAADQKDGAIGIILSGTGSHGTLGVKEIKLAGGIVMVQDPATAEYDQMPRSAIATGVVDHVLPPEQMPEALIRYLPHWRPRDPEAEARDVDRELLKRVLALMQARRKHDFRYYRKNMILRRIRRRMVLLHISERDTYVDFLRNNPQEVDALYNDLLIGVTAFFRDPEAFEMLAAQVLPKLVERAHADAPLRVWVPGCASGEEAYSIAMLLLERFQAQSKPPTMQIFATDVDERTLEVARQGVYPESIAATLSRERLHQFFVKVDRQHYQVNKQLRDSIVFAAQNLIADAPFSQLDLISCRNVLIYLEPEVQEKVISLLHFALIEDGYLLLGPSESIGRAIGMFQPLSKKWSLFRRIGPVRRDLVSIPIVSSTERRKSTVAPEPLRRPPAGFAQLMQKLLAEEFAPASALINREFEILSVQGPLVNYLEFPAGEMTRDLLMLARQGLRIRIRVACQKALSEGKPVVDQDARVRRNGAYVPCTLTVKPLSEPKEAEGLLLVVFQDRMEKPSLAPSPRPAPLEESALVDQLESELRSTREDLQSTIEELESSNEELKLSSEEVMSMNEELQSTNEELETSKEELQSLNEELATVNSQLQDKVEDLDAANSDLTNLMAATDIATIFLDTELRIKRFTPPTSRLLNLLATDVGRPFRDFAPRFTDDDLFSDAHQVLRRLSPIEKLIHASEDHWYLRRILPYRSVDDRIGGVVITFVDITERVAAEAQARRLATVLRDMNDAVIVSSLDGQITGWNRGAEHAYGYTETEALKMNMRDLAPDGLKDRVAEIADRAVRGEEIEAFETQRVTHDGRRLDVWVTVTTLRDASGRPASLARMERDITLSRQAEDEILRLNEALEQRIAERTAALEDSEQRIRSILNATADAILTFDTAGKVDTFNAAAERTFGYAAKEIVGREISLLMSSPDRERYEKRQRHHRGTGASALVGELEIIAHRKDGSEFRAHLSVSEIPALDLYTAIIRDITEQRALQEEIVRISTLEQRRIGEELHDGPQQELAGLGLLAQSLSESLTGGGAGREGDLATRLADGIANVNRQVRSLAQGLVPVPVDAHGLMSGLDGLAKRTAELQGISCRFECPSEVEIQNDDVAMHLYRIAQEAVANAVRHAQPGEITIRLERRDGALVLEVHDDGIGIADQPHEGGLGLRIMDHRCSLIGGGLEIGRRRPKGTVVACRVPGLTKPDAGG
jgi:two-component system, chemotaxis family, CheB/CheR fusion protein